MFQYLTDYPVEKRLEMLKTYYTFTVVRDPIERVLSAYRDKAFDEFRGGIGIFISFEPLIQKFYQGRRTYKFLEKRNQADKFIDYDVESFHRFVAYLRLAFEVF